MDRNEQHGHAVEVESARQAAVHKRGLDSVDEFNDGGRRGILEGHREDRTMLIPPTAGSRGDVRA